MLEAILWILLLILSGVFTALVLASRRNADKYKHRG